MFRVFGWAGTAAAALWVAAACAGAEPADSIAILPVRVELSGPADSQQLVVEALSAGQAVGDLTSRARFESSDPRVARVDGAGVVRPVGDGEARITARVDGRSASVPVAVRGSALRVAPGFRTHVLPALTRAACNSGACHGALAGKGGLKLSLRGYDPAADYDALTRQAAGRRVTRGAPDQSLLLLKPSLQMGHGGGLRLRKGSPDYALVAAWVRAGAPPPREADPEVQALEVHPERASLEAGQVQRIVVRARYSNGRFRDVTPWVKFGTSESRVAGVDEQGRVKVAGPGEAAITVWFSSKVAFARIVSPFPRRPSREVFEGAARRGWIDDLILRKLEALGIPPAPLCSDSEFIRRAFLDVCGILPTPREVEAFLSDSAPDKRDRLVDSLLARPEHVDYWSYKWSDLFLVSSRKLQGRAMTTFYNWIRDGVARNKSWAQMAREILTARGSTLDNGAANFYVLHKDPIALTETTTQAFLGMSVQCARCHNHPLEKWTQNDYYQMAGLFARVRLKNGDQPGGDVLVLTSSQGEVIHPRLGRALPPRPLDGVELRPDDPRDRREVLAEWLTAPENPYFARALVNRVWRSLMGRGLVEAEDDLRLTNPPSNPELLDALAAEFVKSGHDVRRLIRLIMTSASYQRSAVPVPGSPEDEVHYSRAIVRRLPAEVVLDAISQVTGVPSEFPGYPKGTRALQLRDAAVPSYFLTAFGRPDRVQTCSCERTDDPTIAQALHLANGDTVNQKLRAPGGLVDQLLDSGAEDEEVIREAYLAALSRLPTVSERQKLLEALADAPDDPLAPEAERRAVRRPALEDLLWAVLTSKEFLFNH